MVSYAWLIGMLLLLFFGLNILLNYLARRDHEPAPSLKTKIWAIPVLSLLIIGPVTGFAFLYMTFFRGIEHTSTLISFSGKADLFTFSLVILLSFLFFETFIHPLLHAMIRYGLKRPPSVYGRQIITIIADSLLIYVFAHLIPGVYIKDLLSALTLSVALHVIEWILAGIMNLYKKNNKKNVNM
ncbi:hypothetical protein [Paenibacillus sp. UNC499MF]|uniref:hypothetical protein n=1 Tax=Paenibacillus sp. UNC499MF TaxID=1502751 RepID=UPI00089FA1FE|nr:hypothetical protein [Paenibacillus sp. UNC499MF]SEG52696.1 hypothetical protein SAMN02799616_03366 [Paenibacillus sp. UNC499MF]